MINRQITGAAGSRIVPMLGGLLLAFAVAVPTALPGFAQSTPSAQSGSAQKNASSKRESRTNDSNRAARAQERAEALRARLLDLQMRETDLRARLDYLDSQLSPENIERALVFISSVRPRDELRDGLRTRIENEKSRVNEQLQLVVSGRQRLEQALREAESGR